MSPLETFISLIRSLFQNIDLSFASDDGTSVEGTKWEKPFRDPNTGELKIQAKKYKVSVVESTETYRLVS